MYNNMNHRVTEVIFFFAAWHWGDAQRLLGNGYPNNPILPFYPSSDISIEAIHGDCVAIVADEI